MVTALGVASVALVLWALSAGDDNSEGSPRVVPTSAADGEQLGADAAGIADGDRAVVVKVPVDASSDGAPGDTPIDPEANGASGQPPAVLGNVSGVVVNEDGEPLPEATVYLGHSDPSREHSCRARLDGGFEFEGLEGGIYRVTATAPGHMWSLERVGMPTEARLRFVLAPARTLRGRVVREGGGAVGAGVPVFVDFLRRGVTDGQGAFVLRHLPVESLQMTVQGKGLVSAAPFEVEAGRDSADGIVLSVMPGASLEVVARGEGGPVEHANVLPVWIGDDTVGSSLESMQTDSRGSALLTALLPGRYVIAVSAQGWLKQEQAVELTAESTRLVVELQRGSKVEGRILRGREPASDVRLGLARVAEDGQEEPEEQIKTQETGDDGVFAFGGLLPGTYRLRSYSSRGGGRTVTLLSTLTVAKADVQFVEIPLPSFDAEGAIAGQIRGAAPGLRIEVWRHSPDGVEQTRSKTWTDAKGRYRIDGLAPGDYELRLGEGEPSRVMIPAGRTLERDFDSE